MPDDSGERTKRRDRAVLQGAFATGVVRVVRAGTSFVTLGIAARVLTTDEFGLVAMLISLWLILTNFDMGLGGALTTRVAVSHARDGLADVRVHVDHALFALSAIGGFIAVTGTISALTMPWHEWLGGDLPSSTVVRSVIVAFVVSGATLPAAVGYLTLSGMQRFTLVQTCIAAAGLAGMVASAAVAPFQPPPDLFVLTMLGGPLLVTLGFTAWIRFGVLHGVMAPARFEVGRFKDMLRASGWYALYNAANTVSLGTGTVIVGSVLGLAEAAVFAVASRLFSPITSVVLASGTQLWPGMTEAISRGDVAWVRSRYRHGLVSVTGASVALSVVLVAIGPWVAELWVGPDLVPPLSLLVWTAAFTISVAITLQAAVVLMAVERIRVAAALAVCAAVLGVGASVLLTQAVGVNGAAIGALTACLAVLLPAVSLLARSTLRALDPAGGSVHSAR